MSEKIVRVGIGVIVLDGNKVLLCHRINSHGENTWSLAGGHIEFGETPEQAGMRETKEEVNLDVQKIEIICFQNDLCYDKHYITLGAVARKWSGEPKNMEPHKSMEIKWFDLNELPKNMFLPSLGVIEKYKARRFY